LKITQSQFDAIESRFQEIVKEEQLLSDTIDDFLKTTRERVEKQKLQMNSELERIVKTVAALVAPTEFVGDGQPMRPWLPDWQRVPTSDAEIDFQKNLSEELVLAWQDALSADTRAGIERVIPERCQKLERILVRAATALGATSVFFDCDQILAKNAMRAAKD
jgi:hypothetical protein